MLNLKQRAATFAISCLGVLVFYYLSLPLPFLFGPMAACLIAAFAGVQMRGFGQISKAARTILGIAVGATLTPAVLMQMPKIGWSVAVIPLFIMMIAAVGIPYFIYICRYDWPTSYYAAMPGGLQDMVVFGQEAGGNIRTLSLIHATRVLLVVTLAPIVLVQFYGASLTNPIGVPIADVAYSDLALMAIAGLAGWKIAERIGMFGASILGPLILAAIFALTGLLTQRPPAEAINVAQFFIGMVIGIHYTGITIKEFRQTIFSAVIFVVIIALMAAVLAFVLPPFTGLGPIEAFLSFAPAGQAEMTVLAIIVGADLGVVIAHHLVRLVLVITCAPIAAKLFQKRRG